VNIKPVRLYATPQLPTREIVDENPELLRLLPKRWQHNPAVLTAMVGAGLLLQCSGSLLAQDRVPPQGGIKLAGSVLTESEARSIVVEEAKKAGIIFSADKKKLNVPITALAAAPIKGNEASDATTRITLDGTDAKRGISFEYVSEADTKAVSTRIGGIATINSIATAVTAEGKKQLKGRVLVVPEVKAYSRKEADKDLRAQVKDFIKWLKAQGVI